MASFRPSSYAGIEHSAYASIELSLPQDDGYAVIYTGFSNCRLTCHGTAESSTLIDNLTVAWRRMLGAGAQAISGPRAAERSAAPAIAERGTGMRDISFICLPSNEILTFDSTRLGAAFICRSTSRRQSMKLCSKLNRACKAKARNPCRNRQDRVDHFVLPMLTSPPSRLSAATCTRTRYRSASR